MTQPVKTGELLRRGRVAYAHGRQIILVAHPAKLRRREDSSLPFPGLYDISVAQTSRTRRTSESWCIGT